MNNQPSTNIEGYLAIKGLNIKLIQHCRINPLFMDTKLVNIVNNYCNAIISVSNDVYNNLLKNGINSNLCFTVYNGIDIDQKIISQYSARIKLKIPKNELVLCSIGSLILRKSNHHILQSLSIFKKENPFINWKLFIIGKGPEKKKLIKIAISKNIINHIIFTGFLNNPMDYLIACDIFIIASRNEGLPRVILESMLANTVIIGSNVSGISELIKHYQTGLLFQYGNIYQLNKNIKKLYYNKSLRNRLIFFANQRVRKTYNIKNYVSKIEKIFLKF